MAMGILFVVHSVEVPDIITKAIQTLGTIWCIRQVYKRFRAYALDTPGEKKLSKKEKKLLNFDVTPVVNNFIKLFEKLM